ncbi:methyltransferase domain-containing protein [Solimonas sp. K1W22B-7]|uniref:putative RNA methyltransferase n=1 Tax=Solimonas sp. K1W22B-7 TaxID=2303331 RepID=UPI000E334EFD|nr:methyltransferase domain-containing protein [Solimonas sp. K1W22B-7]AXQ28892.1 methyltransferase domain-containing protein [Solimonas sp. K1W22B-7]
MIVILCPVCRQPLSRDAKSWHCLREHSFDVAREGYINLLPVQQKNSREPGDDPQTVMARREFLQAGHYQPLRDALLALAAPLQSQSLLDIGCGEGYYTGALAAVSAQVTGIDIARPAIRIAAKRYPEVTWLVGSGAHLPVADGTVDLVCNIFTQLHVAEMHRVLRPEGHVLVVTPAAGHLRRIREQLFDEVRPYDKDKFLGAFEAQFELRSRQELQFPLSLAQPGLRQLLQMTPYAWKAKPERRAALEASERQDTEAAFSLLLFRRRPPVAELAGAAPAEKPAPRWPGRGGSQSDPE